VIVCGEGGGLIEDGRGGVSGTGSDGGGPINTGDDGGDGGEDGGQIGAGILTLMK